MLEKLRKLLKERFADTKYLLKFTLTGGTMISVVKDEKDFNKFMEWHNSTTSNEFIISSPSGFTSINREHLIQFDYSQITTGARVVNPIGYVLFHPVPRGLTVFSYLKLLLAGFVGSIALLYLKNDLNVINLYSLFGHCYVFIGGFFSFLYVIMSVFWATGALTSEKNSLIELDHYLSNGSGANLTKYLVFNAVLIYIFSSGFSYANFRTFVSIFLNH